jgi:hypothetical protein
MAASGASFASATCRTAWSAILEPVVQTTVDLDQLAEARAAMSRLLHALAALAPRRPQAVRHHPLAERLHRQLQSVNLSQLLLSGAVRAPGAAPARRQGRKRTLLNGAHHLPRPFRDVRLACHLEMSAPSALVFGLCSPGIERNGCVRRRCGQCGQRAALSKGCAWQAHQIGGSSPSRGPDAGNPTPKRQGHGPGAPGRRGRSRLFGRPRSSP